MITMAVAVASSGLSGYLVGGAALAAVGAILVIGAISFVFSDDGNHSFLEWFGAVATFGLGSFLMAVGSLMLKTVS